MKIERKNEITITLDEEDVCAVIFAIKRLTFERDKIPVGTYTHDALFDTAMSIGSDLVDSLESPL